MIMQGECNSKEEKHSFTGLNAAEPKLIICKGNVICPKRKTFSHTLYLRARHCDTRTHSDAPYMKHRAANRHMPDE